METSCAVIGCHPSGASLDLASPDLGERLLGAPSLEAGSCPDEVYISADPSEPSLMRDKLEAMPSCGNPMPFGGGMLGADDIACVEQYITSLQEAAP